MRYLKTTISLIIVLVIGVVARAEQDSVDVLHYDLDLVIRSQHTPHLRGCARLTIVQREPSERLVLDLISAVVDSVFVEGERDLTATYESPTLTVNTAGISAGDTFTVAVYYSSNGYTARGGMGGFTVTDRICYTIGVALKEYPHNMGKSWFPCRDNFTDRATYSLKVNAQPGWTAQCGGVCDSSCIQSDGSQLSCWHIDQPIPTYLMSVVTASWNIITRQFESHYGSYPVTIGYLGHDSTASYHSFDNLEQTVPCFEQRFGPYRWDRIGYVATPVGSMEHVDNICLHTQVMGSQEESSQCNIAHEFAHSWFGNLVTCATAADMWFNEGGASFCEEIYAEAVNEADPVAARDYYMKTLEEVLRTCHIDDGDYRALYDLPHEYTYGTTTYKKGALMWHSLRGHIGDSLFYSSMRTLFDRHAFRSIDSWQVRDSLTRYSGVDLTDFFDFHVFSSGFTDLTIDTLYSNDADETVVVLCQRLLGGTQWLRSDRIPIRIYGENGTYVDVEMAIAGERSEQHFRTSLLHPRYAAVDPEEQMARAVTSADLQINHRGTYRCPLAHFNSVVTSCGDSLSQLRAEHHWIAPDGAMPYGVVRTAQRYWHIVGNITPGTQLKGLFFYVCESNGNATYAHLDRGFYSSPESHDSLRLLYRSTPHSPWTLVSDATLSSNHMEGQLIATHLLPGDYTIAIVDPALLAIASTTSDAAVVCYPNPSSGRVVVSGGKEAAWRMDVTDMSGRLILSQEHVQLPKELLLPKGIYLIQLIPSTEGMARTHRVVVL